MRRCLLILALLCTIPPVVVAQDETSTGDATGLENVQLVVDPGSHTSTIRTLQFSRDGRRLYTFGFDRTVQVWNTATGQRERVLRMPLDLMVAAGGPDVAVGMALSADDRTLAVYGGNRRQPGKVEGFILLIDLPTGAFKTLESPLNLARLVWSPDGKRLAGMSPTGLLYPKNNLTHVWDVATSSTPRSLEPHQARVTAIDFSRDGLLAVASEDETVRIWDLDKTTFKAPLTHDEPVSTVAWAPGGKRLATATGGSVHLWRVEPQRVLESFDPAALGPTCKDAESVAVVSLQFLSATRLFVGWQASLKDGVQMGGASILQARPGGNGVEGYVSPVKSPAVLNVAASPGGEWAALLDGRRIVLWPTNNPDKARVLGDTPPFPSNLGWSLDGKSIGWGGDSRERAVRGNLPPLTHALSLLDLSQQSGQEPIPNLRGPAIRMSGWELRFKDQMVSAWRNGEKISEQAALPESVTLLPDGKNARLAVVEPNSPGVHVFDPETGKLLQRFPSQWGRIFRTVGSPDGKYLLSATHRLRLLIHSQATREHLLTLFVSGEDWVAWTPQGYYAASPGGERIMGFAVQEKPNQLPHFHPASRFRSQLHRPEVIRLVLEKGSVKDALAATSGRRGPAELRTLLPPEVKLELIDVSKLPRQVRVRATASATVGEQPVASLQLILDGRPAPLANDRFAIDPPTKKGTSVVREWLLDVPPGSHRLAVLAQSPGSSSLSEEAAVEGPAAALKAQGKLHLLCVGVSEYANDGKGEENKGLNLKYAAKDATELFAAFKRCQGPDKLFEAGTAVLLPNRRGTSRAVLAELKKLADATLAPGDLVVMHFAGHGEKDDEGKLWLLTHEADRRKPLSETCLSGEKLKDVLAEVPCRVLLILDACHSAALGRPSVSNDLTAMLSDESCGVYVLVAARGRESALEGVKVPINGQEKVVENGLFTWALRQALEGKARSDPYDGRVYTHHVYDHVFAEVRQWSGGKQHPYLGMPWGSKPLPLVGREK